MSEKRRCRRTSPLQEVELTEGGLNVSTHEFDTKHNQFGYTSPPKDLEETVHHSQILAKRVKFLSKRPNPDAK